MGTAATIPMMGKPVQIDSPLQTVGGLMQLRASMNEQALRQAQTVQAQAQTANLQAEAAIHQRAIQDQKTLQSMIGDTTHPEYGVAAAQGDYGFARGRVNETTRLALEKSANDNLEAQAKTQGAQAGLKRAVLDEGGKALAGVKESIPETDQAGRAAALQGAFGRISKMPGAGDMNLQATLSGLSDYSDKSMDVLANKAAMGSAYFGELDSRHLKQEQAAEAAGKGAEAAAAAKKTNFEVGLLNGTANIGDVKTTAASIADPTQAPDVYNKLVVDLSHAKTIAAIQKAQDDASTEMQRRDPNYISAQNAIKVSAQTALLPGEVAKEKALLPLEIQKAIASRQLMTPAQETQTAQMAANGQLDPQTLRAALRRQPGILAAIKQYDPQFDETNIDKRYETLKEFTSTSNTRAGGQVLALNTLIHHADLYQEVGDALKNGSFKPGNAVYNAMSSMMGGPAPQNAATVAQFLAGETGKVATGGVPAEGEINNVLKNLGTSSSPDQIKGAGQTLLQIAAGRMIPLKERVHDAKLDNVLNVVGEDSRNILERRGIDPSTLKAKVSTGNTGNLFPITAPNGKTYTFSSQEDANAFKEKAGIK